MNPQNMPKTDEKWKGKLSEEQYKILREKGTEAAFTGKYYKHKEDGMYVCAGCNAELFDSKTKFESGSGWPSFYDAKEGAVTFKEDTSHGMVRTEALCSKCGGHLGHIFPDGPQDKTGKRYCINSGALGFNPKS